MAPFLVGLLVVALGFSLMMLTYFLTRVAPRRPKLQPPAPFPLPIPQIQAGKDAVLLVEAGGRVLYSNKVARDWFGYVEEQPNLERLVQRAHPSDLFLGLCFSEGQARFTLDGRLVEGVSYFVPLVGSDNQNEPDNSSMAMLVTLQRPKVTSLHEQESRISQQAFDIFAELSQRMASSLELEPTLQAILESVERLIPADLQEITIWDADKRILVPYRFLGVPGMNRRLEKASERHTSDSGYSEYLITQRQPLLVTDVDNFRKVRPTISRSQYPFSSYLGIPLLVADNLIGTLEQASRVKEGFGENDLEVLRILSGPAAVALNNAMRFKEEQKRVLELSGLAQLTQAMSNLADLQDLFSQLVTGISNLVQVRILGFLLYRESHHILEAQSPFLGIPDQFLNLYRVDISPGSPAEAILFKQEHILASDAVNNPTLKTLSLDGMAVASGIQATLFIPLKTPSRFLGLMQAADRLDGLPFNQDDLRLLEIIAGQAAVIIENAMLVKESQTRAQRSETLRRVASLAGSTATLDEILTHSLRELARLLRVEIGIILILDENLSELRLHMPSLLVSNQKRSLLLDRLNMTDPRFQHTATGSMQFYFSEDIDQEPGPPPPYHQMLTQLQARSVLIVPFVVRGQGVGEILLGSQENSHFDQNDLTLVSTTASQLSIAIEKSALYGQTDESLRRRVVQLLALNRISRELNTTLELKRLLRVVHEQVVETTEADCGAILLFGEAHNSKTNPRVSFQVGDAGSGSLTPIELKVLRAGESYLVRDYLSPDPNAPDTMPIPPHPGVRSSLIVPIAFQDYVVGLIHLHAQMPDRFDATSQEIAQSVAVQAAIAIGNAQRYQEQQTRNELLNRRVETLTALLETTQYLRAGQPLEESLETIAYGIQTATPFEVVLVSIYDPQKKCLVHISGAGVPLDMVDELKSNTPTWESIQEILQPQFLYSRSYFIPHDREATIPPEVYVLNAEPVTGDQASRLAWHLDDLLLVPLISSEGQPLGLIRVDAPRNYLRPDRPAIESLEIFASQAALVIETFQKITQLGERSAELAAELEQTRLVLQEMQNELPRLLEKDQEQEQALSSLSFRQRRLRAGLDIADQVDQQHDRDEILLTLAQKVLTNMSMNVVLVAEMREGGLHLLHRVGEIPPGVNPQALLGQRNPLRSSLQTGEAIFVTNLETQTEWAVSPLLTALEARSFICQPILSLLKEPSSASQPARIDSALLAISHKPLEQFSHQDEEVFAVVSRQVTISLQNRRLIDEANHRLQEMNLLLEFNRQLGSLDTTQIIQSLVEGVLRVVPAAQAGMAALWSAERELLQPMVALNYANNAKILQIPYRSGESLPGRAYAEGLVLCPHEVNFPQDYTLSPEQLLLYRDGTQGRLPISSLIVPLQTFEGKLGVLVLDNFREAGAFSQDDQTLVLALTRQTALTLENVRLYQAAEQRTAQLQALTKVAGTITSSLQREDLIRSLLEQVRSVVPFDVGTLWLRHGDQMTVRAASGFAGSEERLGLSVALEDSLLLRAMAITNQPLSVNDVRKDERFPKLVEHLYLSWLGVPLLSKGEVVGVIVLEKTEENFYTPEHLQAMVTFASQAAVGLENATLYEESLSRAAELDERSQRLALLNRLSSALSGSLDPERILGVLAGELRQAANASMVSVALLDETGEVEVHIQEPPGTSSLPLSLPANPVFERLRETLGVYLAEDVVQEPELVSLMPFFKLTSTKSLLIVPLISGSNLIGLSLIHSEHSYRFSPDEVALMLTISNQVAVAIQNARLFRETERLIAETQERSTELATLFDLGVRFTQVLDQNRLLDITFDNLARLIQPEVIEVALLESEVEMTAFILDHGVRREAFRRPRQGGSLSEHVIRSNQPVLISDTLGENQPFPNTAFDGTYRSWLGVPLVVRGRTNGVISMQSNQAQTFGEIQLRLLGQIANQLSVALDNAQLFSTVQNYTEELEQRVSERTEQVAREHRRIQTLLSITTELSASLDLDLVLNRTLGVLNETIEAEHSAILLVQPDSPYLYLRASLGYTGNVPFTGQISKVKRNEGLSGWVLNNRQSVLVGDLHTDPRWERRDDRTGLHRSAMVVPLLVGEDIMGVIMVYHRNPTMFNTDQLDLVQAVAKQIAIAINNTQLYGLIRDQAERLGDMLRTQHVETSRSQAILEAVADGVLVTDARRKITLFNASAEKMLDLSRAEVLGQSLENFTGLFGDAAINWVQTIRTWSEDPDSYAEGETYAAQIELDNRRIVSVHLSPVHLRNDFLGTVSIFRDITHQVEVDRLKSEFVATVSHELRTPMTSIKGYVEILLMGAAGQLNQQQGHFLDVVKTNTERLSILVNDLLDVSRIEAGKVTLALQPVDLRPVTDEIIEAITRRMAEERRPMQFHKEIPVELPAIYGDPERVHQILDNIIENAYQYTPVDGEIWITIRQIGRAVQIDVRDNGIGIKPEEKSRIFERFYRGEDPLVLSSSGTGLGLAIVQTLVNMHGGRIWFESQGIPGLGSVFSFTLPVYDPNRPMSAPQVRLGQVVGATSEFPRQPSGQELEHQPSEAELDDSDLILGLEPVESKLDAAETPLPGDDDKDDWTMK